MRPTERARQYIEHLLKMGVAQKVVAARMGVSETTFSRWYRGRPELERVRKRQATSGQDSEVGSAVGRYHHRSAIVMSLKDVQIA